MVIALEIVLRSSIGRLEAIGRTRSTPAATNSGPRSTSRNSEKIEAKRPEERSLEEPAENETRLTRRT